MDYDDGGMAQADKVLITRTNSSDEGILQV
jgi:hypothetical protein